MSLEIRHLDDRSARGTLDGALPFEVRRNGKTLTARIAGWLHVMHDEAISTAADMRMAAYAALARYRDEKRQA